jgi:hypothetical protein
MSTTEEALLIDQDQFYKDWFAALRSDRFKQTGGHLGSRLPEDEAGDSVSACCLGVAAIVATDTQPERCEASGVITGFRNPDEGFSTQVHLVVADAHDWGSANAAGGSTNAKSIEDIPNFGGSTGLLPSSVARRLGGDYLADNQIALSDCNDKGATFREIADAVEADLAEGSHRNVEVLRDTVNSRYIEQNKADAS